MFLHLSVCLSVHRGSASVHAGIPQPRDQAPPRSSNRPEQTPLPEQTPPEQTTPQADPL